MTGQPSLFDLPAAKAARDEAIVRVAEHSTDEWIYAAREAVRQTAVDHERFICDQVWATGLRRPENDSRALGAVMLWAARHGLIAKTGDYRPSAAVASHAVPRVVWASLICEAVA